MKRFACALSALSFVLVSLQAAGLTVGLVDVCKTNETAGVPSVYVRALEKAGHVPVVLPRVFDRKLAAGQVKAVDLVFFCGGEDVDPARYGLEKSPHCELVNGVRDACEWRLLDECVRIRRPVFGICRGAQLINCHFGGTLYQDLNTEVAGVGRHRHAPNEKDDYIDHDVDVLPGTRLGEVLGVGRHSVKAWHHQAVCKLAPGFRVSARAADGVVEAIESDAYPAAGLQFHPEQSVCSDADSRLLEVFCRLDFLCGVK